MPILLQEQRRTLAAVHILDMQLSNSLFLAGNDFTFGDIPAAAAVHRWYSMDTPHPALKHLRRWYERMTEREPFRNVVMTPLS
jgi:glutathione S-transferase